MPIPAQRRLFTQLANAVERAANKWGAGNRQGAVLAIRNHRALQEARPEQTEPPVLAREAARLAARSLQDSTPADAPAAVIEDRKDSQPSGVGADRERPAADVKRADLERVLCELDELDLPDAAKTTLAETLQRDGNTACVCAIESVDDEDDVKWVILHLPSHHSQNVASGGEASCGGEIDLRERWHNAESIRDALLLAWPSTDIYIGRLKADEEVRSYLWQEYPGGYDDPPDYLAGFWSEDDEADQDDRETPDSPTVPRLVSWLRKRRAARTRRGRA